MIDFLAVYNRTFQTLRAYWESVDYEQLPENFTSYSTIDRDRIQRRMQVIQTKVAAGIDLSAGAFPIENDA